MSVLWEVACSQAGAGSCKSNSELSAEAVSAFAFRFRYGRDGTISPSPLLWYRQLCPRDRRSITNASAIMITATAAAEAPPIVFPSVPASKLWPGPLLVAEGAALGVPVLGSAGPADTGRGIRERARRVQSSMGEGG